MRNCRALIFTLSSAALAATWGAVLLPSAALGETICDGIITMKECKDTGCYWCNVAIGSNMVGGCEPYGGCSAFPNCDDKKYGTMSDLYSAIPAEENDGKALSVIVKGEPDDYCKASGSPSYYLAPDCETCRSLGKKWCQFAVTLDGDVVARGGQCSDDCAKHVKTVRFYLASRFGVSFDEECPPEPTVPPTSSTEPLTEPSSARSSPTTAATGKVSTSSTAELPASLTTAELPASLTTAELPASLTTAKVTATAEQTSKSSATMGATGTVQPPATGTAQPATGTAQPATRTANPAKATGTARPGTRTSAAVSATGITPLSGLAAAITCLLAICIV